MRLLFLGDMVGKTGRTAVWERLPGLISDLKLDFANPSSETIGVEFTNTSITSGGDGSETAAAWERIRAGNPHIKLHSNRRGYVACTATATTMRAEFKVIDRVTIPDQAVRTAGALVVESGRPGAMTD